MRGAAEGWRVTTDVQNREPLLSPLLLTHLKEQARKRERETFPRDRGREKRRIYKRVCNIRAHVHLRIYPYSCCTSDLCTLFSSLLYYNITLTDALVLAAAAARV